MYVAGDNYPGRLTTTILAGWTCTGTVRKRGIIAALIAQDMAVEHAAVLGVWLHGQAGDEAWVAIGGKGVLTA